MGGWGAWRGKGKPRGREEMKGKFSGSTLPVWVVRQTEKNPLCNQRKEGKRE